MKVGFEFHLEIDDFKLLENANKFGQFPIVLDDEVIEVRRS
jgi:hypothetical protein